MKAQDVTTTLDLALATSGLDHMTVVHRPRLLFDNGSSYVASDLAVWLDKQNIEHVRGAPFHPQTQGKIERWLQTLIAGRLSLASSPGSKTKAAPKGGLLPCSSD
jgi:putative transposase